MYIGLLFLLSWYFFKKLKERRGLDSQLRGTVYHGGDIKGSTSLRMWLHQVYNRVAEMNAGPHFLPHIEP